MKHILHIILLLVHLLVSIECQTFINVGPGQTRNIPQGTTCSDIVQINVDGGTAVVTSDCTTSATIVVTNGGTFEVQQGRKFIGNQAKFLNGHGIIRGTFQMTSVNIEQSSTFELFANANLSVGSQLSVLSGAQFKNHGRTLWFPNLVVNAASLLCTSRCSITAINVKLTNSRFLANAVSTAHQDCANSGVTTTLASGGNHAGCSGEHICCPISSLKPVGDPYRPTHVGYKGGTCALDGAGLGGGAWVLIFNSLQTLSGIQRIEANGGSPSPGIAGAAGGGSGGSILIDLLSTKCDDQMFNAFRLYANGGDAVSNTGESAYGGSAGRIAIRCQATDGYRRMDHLYNAYGGHNAAANGWGAAGTMYVPNQWMENYVPTAELASIHIYERKTNYNQSPLPYFPATFFDITDIHSNVNSQWIAIHADSRSDMYLYASKILPTEVLVTNANDEEKDVGALVNASPNNVVFHSASGSKGRVWPLMPPAPGICYDWYIQFQPPSATRSRTPSRSHTSTPTSTRSVSSTNTGTRTATPTSTRSLSSTSTGTRTATPTPSSTKTRTATPTPSGGPCKSSGPIKVGAGQVCNYQVSVDLTTVEVVAGGQLTFSAGLTATKIIATSPGLLEFKNQNVVVGDLILTNTKLVVDSGLTINANSVQMSSSTIESQGVLTMAIHGPLAMDATSRITAAGKGHNTPTNSNGGDSRGIKGSGGVHAGCAGNDCALRHSHGVKAYGNAFHPIQPGVSGTGPGSGAGGGVITITCATFSSVGVIDVSGAHGSGTGGGGAGGSLHLSATEVDIKSAPLLLARGGDAGDTTGHPGSGGRIAVTVNNAAAASIFLPGDRYSIRGGTYTNSGYGPPGTYYLAAGDRKYLSSSSNGGRIHGSTTTFVFCDPSLCPTLTEAHTDSTNELVFSRTYVGTGCGTAQAHVEIDTIRVDEGSYVSTSPCVTMVANNYLPVTMGDVPKLIVDTTTNQQYLETYYNAHFAYESWNIIKNDVVASNVALGNRLDDAVRKSQQCDTELDDCMESCHFPMFERPTDTIKGGDVLIYRMIATRTGDSPISEDDRERGKRVLSAYLASTLLYPRANIVYDSFEIRGSSMIVYYSVTVPASGSRAGHCLEAHLRWTG